MVENFQDYKNKKSPKILYIINSLDIGGAETLLYHTVKEIVKKGLADVTVCTLYGKGALGEKLASEGGVKIIDLSLKQKYSHKAIVCLLNLFKENEYNIVHAHLFPSGYYAAIASLFSKSVKLIYTEHNVFNRRRKYKFIRPIERFIYKRFNVIIAVGNIVRAELIKWLPSINNKVITIPNAIPIEYCSETANKDIDILFVGRLEKVKGVDILLKAVKKLNGNYKTVIVGDGSERKNLECLANELELNDNVSFTGIRYDVIDFMCRAKVFVLPSRWEGIPLTLLEAMSLGLPVIATKVGGNTELINSNENGVLVEPDNIREFVDNIKLLMGNTFLRDQLGDKAKKKLAEKFSIDAHVDKLINIYVN